MTLIPINGRKGIVGHAQIDDEDVELVSKYKWHLSRGYAVSTSKKIRMHRLVMNQINHSYESEIDHINRNRLDNTKVNLRIVSRLINCHNSGATRNSKTGVKGISIRGRFYYAQFTFKRKKYYAGRFLDINAAKRSISEKYKLVTGLDYVFG